MKKLKTYDICYSHFSNIQIEATSKASAIKQFKQLANEWLDNDMTNEQSGTYELNMMAVYDKNGDLKPLKVKEITIS